MEHCCGVAIEQLRAAVIALSVISRAMQEFHTIFDAFFFWFRTLLTVTSLDSTAVSLVVNLYSYIGYSFVQARFTAPLHSRTTLAPLHPSVRHRSGHGQYAKLTAVSGNGGIGSRDQHVYSPGLQQTANYFEESIVCDRFVVSLGPSCAQRTDS